MILDVNGFFGIPYEQLKLNYKTGSARYSEACWELTGKGSNTVLATIYDFDLAHSLMAHIEQAQRELVAG